MSTLKEIYEFIEKISKLDIDNVEIKTDKLKIKVEKNTNKLQQIPQSVVSYQPIVSQPTPQQPLEPTKQQNTPPTQQSNIKTHIIKSPMVGTFYRRPKPDQPNFVEIGSRIKKGDIVCIIEAMKLFNEIESDIDGEVINIFVEDGKPVEYDQPLFEIKLQ